MFRQPLLDRGWQQQQLVGLIRAEGFHVPQYPHPVSPRQRFDDYSDRLLAQFGCILDFGARQDPIPDTAVEEFLRNQVHSMPAEEARKLILDVEDPETDHLAGLESTSTSTSLSGPKSSLRTEPNSASFRM